MLNRDYHKQEALYQRVAIYTTVYKQLKEYCILNHLSMAEMATKFIREGLMIEKYGDAPFMKMVKSQKPIEPEITTAIDEHWDELLDSADRIDVKVVVSKPISAITQNIIIERDDTATPVEENTNAITLEEKNEKEELNNKATKKRRLN